MPTSQCPNRNYDVPGVGNAVTGQCCDPSKVVGLQNKGLIWNEVGTRACYTLFCGPTSNLGSDNCDQKFAGPGERWQPAFYKYDRSGIQCDECVNICYKVQWNPANKLNCCTGKYDDIFNCDPTWCPSNLDVCTDVLIPYCSDPANVASDPTCVKFCSIASNKVYCDPAMRTYCANNPSDRICTCLNSTIPRPSCFDSQCISTGYQTQEMIRNSVNCGTFCGEFINCVQVNQCNINEPTFIERCGNVIPSNMGGGGGSISFKVPGWVWVAIGIVGIAIILIIGVYLVFLR